MGYTTSEIPNPDAVKVAALAVDPYSPYYIPGVGEEITGLPSGMKLGDPYTGGATGRMDAPETLTQSERVGGGEVAENIIKKAGESQGKGPIGSMPHAGRFPEERAQSPYIDIVGLAKERAKKWAKIAADARSKAASADTKRRELMEALKKSEE